MAKKIVISLTLGAVLLGIGVWAGLTWLFGSGAETVLSETDYGKSDDEDSIEFFQASGGEYHRGFLSSDGSTYLGFPNDDADGDGLPDHSLVLNHKVYHGPLAMTPDGVIPCSNYVVTTLAVDQLPEEVRKSIGEIFAEQAPLTIRTTTGISRQVTTRISAAPFTIAEDEHGRRIEFDGFDSVYHIAGTEDHLSLLQGSATIGGWRIIFPEGRIEASEGSAEIDYQNEEHLTGHLTLGEVTGTGPNQVSARLGTIKLSFDHSRVSESVPILLGETQLHFSELSISMADHSASIKDGVILGASGNDDGKIHGRFRYGIGEIRIPPELAGPAAPFLPTFEKGVAIEVGGRGFDFAALEGAFRDAQRMQEIQFKQMGKSLENGQFNESDSPELQEATRDYMEQILGLIVPGAEIYEKLEINGRSGESVAKVSMGLQGEKPLREIATLGELLESISAEAAINISKADLPPEQMAAIAGGLMSMGFLRETASEIVGTVSLTDGLLVANGQPSPILEAMELPMDQPIPWDEFLDGAAAGAKDAGKK
ncbi:MAG: DUF945 family protein [Verrucomicrobiae bacterium]|nr:DUF945 family protein [Verrucomicrobiae bacterium]